MEAIFPVIGMAMGGVVSSAVGGGVLGAIAAGAVSVGVSYLGNEVFGSSPSAQTPAPIPPPSPLPISAPGRSELIANAPARMVRQAITSHRVVYGEIRTGGPLVYAHLRAPAKLESLFDEQ
ncbi:hypothetical protein WCLP8_1220001 [uncultured Gammaproteobacteria bacterium]